MTLEMKLNESRYEGDQHGIAIGEARGEKRGRIEGIQQNRYETARKKKQDNFSYEMISKYTNLSKEEISDL